MGPNFTEIENQAYQGTNFQFRNANLAQVINTAIPYVFTFAGILLLIFFIIGGYKLMLSAGDPKKAAEGKATITHAIIGFIIIFIAFWIVQIIAQFLGLDSVFSTFGNSPSCPTGQFWNGQRCTTPGQN